MSEKNSFLLPIVSNFDIKVCRGDRKKLLYNLGYSPELNKTKNFISDIKFSRWSRVRSLVNCLEFPYDPRKIKKPISRAFFKLLEIIKDHKISTEGNTLHLAEAPGGFIEATKYIKEKKKNYIDLYYTFSILGGKSLPIYNRSLLMNKNIKVLSNKDNNGDLYDTKNIKYIIDYLDKENVMFITADGGFDENNNFESKEELHHKLIFNQIVTSLYVLKNGGSFIIKIFDIFTELTFDFVYLLSYLFSEVYIHKPSTSRPTNSEKYIVCKHYRRNLFDKKIQKTLKDICLFDVNNISSFIDKKNISQDYIKIVKDINIYFSECQIKNIKEIIQIERLNLLINSKENKIKEWVDTYY